MVQNLGRAFFKVPSSFWRISFFVESRSLQNLVLCRISFFVESQSLQNLVLCRISFFVESRSLQKLVRAFFKVPSFSFGPLLWALFFLALFCGPFSFWPSSAFLLRLFCGPFSFWPSSAFLLRLFFGPLWLQELLLELKKEMLRGDYLKGFFQEGIPLRGFSIRTCLSSKKHCQRHNGPEG